MAQQLKDEEIEVGQHLWVLENDSDCLLVVMKNDKGHYQNLSNCPFSMAFNDFEILELINRPAGHEETELYYL